MFSSHLHHLIDPDLEQCHSKRKYPYLVLQFNNNNRLKSVWRWGKSQKVIYFFVLSQFVECLEDCLPLLLQANTSRSRTNPLGLVALLLLSLANGQKRQHQSNPLLFFAPSFFLPTYYKPLVAVHISNKLLVLYTFLSNSTTLLTCFQDKILLLGSVKLYSSVLGNPLKQPIHQDMRTREETGKPHQPFRPKIA